MGHRARGPKLTLQDCRDRIRRNPKDLEARMMLGMAYRLQGDFSAAVEMWKSILEIDPSHDAAKRLVQSLEAERMKINSGLE